MNMNGYRMRSALFAFLLFSFLFSSAQNGPGKILRSAPVGAVRTALDPNADDFVSAGTAGFSGGDDVSTSEIPFKPIVPYNQEPNSDLRRGPSSKFSDFVPGIDNASYYMHYRNNAGSEALLFRMRMGSVMPGAKGYSVLLDTDGKFGASGPNADPNYVAATTGTGGNPGFEVEIVLATGGGSDGVLIYNVDGTDNPGAPTVLSGWTAYSQIAIAATNDNGDPDFYLDWYVPQTALTAVGITASTPFRVVPTTVMAPKGAIGGPKSDIYGLADNNYKDPMIQYETYINSQPSLTLTTLSVSGTASPTAARCTAPPVLTGPVTPGTVNIAGTWTRSPLTGATSTATIRIYVNGALQAQNTSVTSNGNTVNWTVTGVTVGNGQTVLAKAVASGETECLSSNLVVASNCNASNTPPQPVLDCYNTSKGISGTNLSTGWTVNVDNLTRNTQENSSANTGGLFGANAGTSPNLTWVYSGGCASGSPLTSGSYKVYYVNNVSGCASAPAYVCVAGNGGNALAGSVVVPALTAPAGGIITSATKIISGTTAAGAAVGLYIDGKLMQTATATGGNFSFANLSFVQGQTVQLSAEYNTGTVSTSRCAAQTALFTVSCFTAVPGVVTNANGQLRAGQSITGTSGEPAGTVIRLYTSAPTLVSTTTVQSNGTWSTANAGSTPANYT
ncbi:MAG TPA: hypothetical protein VM871_12715, partial [Flavisolibacter sp.]|nr:hypothetical protein [Flavisolibacter sp.]